MNTLQPILDFYRNDASRWTQGVFARNSCGFETNAFGSDAVSWCLNGAIHHMVSNHSVSAKLLFREIATRTRNEGEITWNDQPDRTFDDVVKMLSLEDGQRWVDVVPAR